MNGEDKIIERVARLEEENKSQNKLMEDFKKTMVAFGEKIDIIEKTLLGRPSWIVMAFISILISLCTFFASYIALRN